MLPKSLKVTVPIKAEGVEEAIAQLSGRFLRATRSGAKVVQEPTDFRLLELCKPLVADWKSGKVAFSSGEITFTFTSGKLAQEADVLVFKPALGDRFLYTGQAIASVPQQLPISGLADSEAITPAGNYEVIAQVIQPLQTFAEALTQLAAHQRAVESRLQALLLQNSQVESQPKNDPTDIQDLIQHLLNGQASTLEQQLQAALEAQANTLNQQLQAALDAQAATLTQIFASQVSSTALHFNQRIDSLQTQLETLAAQLEELGEFAEPNLTPQTESEWIALIKQAWGTVGDYEQYSLNHRLANAETPLFATPDWVALCELDWVRQLSPTLFALYDLIHGDTGIGYSGADILQQFGRHLDPHTTEPYYIYHQGGFTAYEALWQTVSNLDHSWLPDMQRLSARTASRHHDVFELFGWEAEAIASLESVVKRATYQQQSERQSERQSTSDSHSHAQPKTNAISDYLAILNIGPFTPITLELIKRAYRQVMKSAHPDTGGSKERAQQVNEAYIAVLKHYFPQAT